MKVVVYKSPKNNNARTAAPTSKNKVSLCEKVHPSLGARYLEKNLFRELAVPPKCRERLRQKIKSIYLQECTIKSYRIKLNFN